MPQNQTLKPSTYFSYLYSRTDNMAEFCHEDSHYPAMAANGWIKEEREEVHEENPEEGPGEYQEVCNTHKIYAKF